MISCWESYFVTCLYPFLICSGHLFNSSVHCCHHFREDGGCHYMVTPEFIELVPCWWILFSEFWLLLVTFWTTSSEKPEYAENVSLPLTPKISVWFYHLTVAVHRALLTWTLGSGGVQAWGWSGKCTGLDAKDSENSRVSLSAWEIFEKSLSLSGHR